MNPVLCIHPKSEDLQFLTKTIEEVKKILKQDFRHIVLANNVPSHDAALCELSRTTCGLVLVLCHGTSSQIRGSDTQRLSADDPTTFEYPDFITKGTCRVFCGKHVFCFSCDSNGLAKSAVSAGAVSFLGFNRIRFNYESVEEHRTQLRCVEFTVKREINAILKETLVPALTSRLELCGIAVRMKAVVNQHTVHYVNSNRKDPHRKEIANILIEIAEGIHVFGNPSARWDS